MRLASSAPFSRAPVLATLVLVVARLATCEPEFRPTAPAIVVARGRYTVAWSHDHRFELQQFSADSLKPLGKRTTIIKRDDLVAGADELVAVDRGYLAIGRVEDPEKKPNWATHILTMPVDADGQIAGEAHQYFPDYACHGAGVVGEYVLIAYKQFARSHRYPYDTLGILAVDHHGSYRGMWIVGSNPSDCASAVRGNVMAIAWTTVVRSGEGYARELHVAFEEPRRDGRHDSVRVEVGHVGAWPTRIVSLGAGWAILYFDPETSTGERGHIAFVDDHGTLLGTRDLPAEVDRKTADLSASVRGLFVSWISNSRVRVVGLAGTPRRLAAANSSASQTRALGDGASCVTAWTTNKQKRVQLAKAAGCP